MADIVDSKTNEVVWRGVVKDTVNGIGQSRNRLTTLRRIWSSAF